MGKMWEKGKAELAASARYGLQDAQRLVMGEWGGTIPNQPGMAGAVTPAEADRQLNVEADRNYLEEKTQQPVAPQPDEPEMEME